jgi:hypothetical protein
MKRLDFRGKMPRNCFEFLSKRDQKNSEQFHMIIFLKIPNSFLIEISTLQEVLDVCIGKNEEGFCRNCEASSKNATYIYLLKS